MRQSSKPEPERLGQKKERIKSAALGGTFDRFHEGHRRFLKQAFRVSDKVLIGVTGDEFASKLHADARLQTHRQRKSQVMQYLKEKRFQARSQVVDLNDAYGPTQTDKTLQALIVTSQTLISGRDVNRLRRKRNLPALKLVHFPLVRSRDGKVISSQRIREGKITREGVVYFQELSNATPLKLPRILRSTFREPFGRAFPGTERNIYESMRKVIDAVGARKERKIVCVGDLVTHSIVGIGMIPQLSIADFMIRRRKRFSSLADLGPFGDVPVERVKNPAGTITKRLTGLIHRALKSKNPSVILVKGEEDLAVLPCVLLAPLNAMVFYGHFQHGIIVVKITEEKKSEALKLLRELTRLSNEM